MILANVPVGCRARCRPGFSLIELLVVIGIIAILAALLAGAAFQVMAQQQKSNTEVLLQKTSDALTQQWNAVVDQAKTEAIPTGPNAPADNYAFLSALSIPSGAGAQPDEKRIRAMWIIIRLRQEFPVNYQEAVNDISFPVGSKPPKSQFWLPAKKSYVAAIGGPSNNGNTESAACLLLALAQGRRGMASLNPDEAFGSNAVQDTDGDGLKEIVDSWGTAIAFCRWPTGDAELATLGGPNPRSLLDPTRTLTAPLWNNAGNANRVNTFEILTGPPGLSPNSPGQYRTRNAAGAPHVYYMVPVVGSAGRNKAFGVIALDLTITNANQANDNLYNYRLKIAGKGD